MDPKTRRGTSNYNLISTTTATTNAASEIDTRKIENITEGLASYCFNMLHTRVLPQNRENAMTICEYISSMKHELNLSDNYREDVIMLLSRFSIFFKNAMVFKQITREDLLSFIDSYRKPEASDPMHKWIGTYNIMRMHLMRFFRWLFYPDVHPSKDRPKPPSIENIPALTRKEKSIYKPTDLWTEEDDSLFLKYCPNPRDKCYHTMSRDSACRPHELLKLRIKDVVFKLTPYKKQYAEVVVNGKTGTRSIPLINSIPYLKDWINQHPQGRNPNSILICGLGKSIGRAIQVISLNTIYKNYRDKFFPKLLDNSNVLPEDKHKIRELLKKPWNPYIRRHSALTEKSGILKEHYLRQFAGWSPGSNMHLKYLHYFGNESNDSLLEAYGLVTKDKKLSDALRPKQCPNCDEPNKPDSKFCAKCRMVLTYDAYNDTLENQTQKEDKLSSMEKQFNIMQSQFQTLITFLGGIKDQKQINQTAQMLYKLGILNLTQQT
jgi:integrase